MQAKWEQYSMNLIFLLYEEVNTTWGNKILYTHNLVQREGLKGSHAELLVLLEALLVGLHSLPFAREPHSGDVPHSVQIQNDDDALRFALHVRFLTAIQNHYKRWEEGQKKKCGQTTLRGCMSQS